MRGGGEVFLEVLWVLLGGIDTQAALRRNQTKLACETLLPGQKNNEPGLCDLWGDMASVEFPWTSRSVHNDP